MADGRLAVAVLTLARGVLRGQRHAILQEGSVGVHVDVGEIVREGVGPPCRPLELSGAGGSRAVHLQAPRFTISGPSVSLASFDAHGAVVGTLVGRSDLNIKVTLVVNVDLGGLSHGREERHSAEKFSRHDDVGRESKFEKKFEFDEGVDVEENKSWALKIDLIETLAVAFR